MLRTNRADQAAVLQDGRADVSYVRLPVDRHGLQLRTLLREPNVAVLPAGHLLAGKETISLADLAFARRGDQRQDSEHPEMLASLPCGPAIAGPQGFRFEVLLTWAGTGIRGG